MSHHVRRGEAADGPYSLSITPASAGWEFSALRILELGPGGAERFASGEDDEEGVVLDVLA